MKRIKTIIALSVLLISINTYGQEFYTNMTYNISVPMGETADFISNTSFRGATFNMGRFLTDKIAVDMRFSWNTFYQAMDFDTYTSDNGLISVSGTQFRYINAFPITLGARYVLNASSNFSPYFAAGLGTYKINERLDMGIYSNEIRKWHFGMYPELGFFYRLSYDVGINMYARYDHAFKTSSTKAYSYIAFGLGFHFTKL